MATHYFVKEDWELFRDLPSLAQKAGVAMSDLPALVMKELTDNGLDVGANVKVGRNSDGNYFVQDDGPGIKGGPEKLVELFSFRRPLMSTKLERMPTRGALGNGLRVVAGVVFAARGWLRVSTCGEIYVLTPLENGNTDWMAVRGKWRQPGTMIEIGFGSGSLDVEDEIEVTRWADEAIALARSTDTYKGKTSAHWYTDDDFHGLFLAARKRTALSLVRSFDGCAEPKAGELAAPFAGRQASSLSKEEATNLLTAMREASKPVKPERLGFVGKLPSLPNAYAKSTGMMPQQSTRGSIGAEVPYVLEVWARPADTEDDEGESISLSVNRTPTTADVYVSHDSGKSVQTIQGCELNLDLAVGRKPMVLTLNVQTPYFDKTSDGKAPDLSWCEAEIEIILMKAVNKAKRDSGGERKQTIKQSILDALPEAMAQHEGHRFSQRQLLYSVRGIMLKQGLAEPKWGTFTKVIDGHEFEIGEDIPGMYRDSRGIILHPHTGEEIPLGTLSVEQYERPDWLFNKFLYIEKEGLVSILRDEKFPERHDCALLTSKGQATRAVKDVIDRIGETDQEITFFCVHDADGPGSIIYQALQEATKARAARRVKIINLGLEPSEAIAMGLQVEPVKRKKKGVSVARYVEAKWRTWLQTKRVELNAMTTPQFLAWLERKMAPYNKGKVIPPKAVQREKAESDLRAKLREGISARILKEQGFDAQVDKAMKKAIKGLPTDLTPAVRKALKKSPEKHWTRPVADIAETIAAKVLNTR